MLFGLVFKIIASTLKASGCLRAFGIGPGRKHAPPGLLERMGNEGGSHSRPLFLLWPTEALAKKGLGMGQHSPGSDRRIKGPLWFPVSGTKAGSASSSSALPPPREMAPEEERPASG